MSLPTPELLAAARRTLAYLAATDDAPAAPVDAILGFGVFDLRLPVFCGELFQQGAAPRIIFTGGVGAGSGRLVAPEAEAWRAALRQAYPAIPDSAVILEPRSTNTAENIAFTSALLARDFPDLAFGRGLRRVIVVASPSRLRRVRLTLAHLQPNLTVIRRLPPVSLESEWAAYGLQGIDYIAHLAGELDRLVDYPAKGWIAAEPLPPEIAAAHTVLRAARPGV
jgi:uncharacterized SAM-binding protein YcdF (DUF218 family)